MTCGFRICKEEVRNLLKVRNLAENALAALPMADIVRVLMRVDVSKADIGKVIIYLSTEYENQDHTELSDEAASLVKGTLHLKANQNSPNQITAYPLRQARKTCRDGTSVMLQSVPVDTTSEVSKRYTGITNSGSTCYLNSTIQVLYHIPLFRKLIYSIDVTMIECSESSRIVLALQSLFFALEKKESSISTSDLTDAFGWTNSAKFVQHDTHEMIQKLFESLEVITKGTDVGTSIYENFFGDMLFYIQCLDVDHRTSRCEKFLDLQVVVSGCSSLKESLDLLVKTDKLDGKYLWEHADGTSTRHPAEMGSLFSKIPPVLFVHPSRAFFCMERLERVTFDTEWTFPTRINLNDYLQSTSAATAGTKASPNGGTDVTGNEDMGYELRSVVIHSGTALAGHYYCYVNFEGKWVCFNDTYVSDVDESTVLKEAFSTPSKSTDYWGESTLRPSYKRATLLTYVRISAKDLILSEVNGNDISTLKSNLALVNERRRAYEEEKKRIENLITVRVLIEDSNGLFLDALSSHQDYGKLVDIKIDKRGCFIKCLRTSLASQHNIPEAEIENIWMYDSIGVVKRAPYYAAILVHEKTSYSGREIFFVQMKPLQKGIERRSSLNKTDFREQFSYEETPKLIHLSVLLSKSGTIEFKKSFSNFREVLDCLDAIAANDFSIKTKPNNNNESSLRVSEFEARDSIWNYFVVREKEIVEVQKQSILSGEVIIVTPKDIYQEDITYAYDKVHNLVSSTVYLLDSTETPVEVGVLRLVHSATVNEVQQHIFNMICDTIPNVSRVLPLRPIGPEYLGLRTHDHNNDKPYLNISNSLNTLKNLVSDCSHHMPGKLYVQVLPVPLQELENSNYAIVLCRVSYDFCRYTYIPYKGTIMYGEVLQNAMKQLYPLMPPRLSQYVQDRMNNHCLFRSAGKKDFTSGFDPVFRIKEFKYHEYNVSWEYPITFQANTTYVIDMLPPNYSDIFTPYGTSVGEGPLYSDADTSGSAHWYERTNMLKSLSHADRRSGELNLYGVDTLLVIPKELSNVTGAEVMDLVAKHYRFHPSMVDKQEENEDGLSFYETAVKKWRLAFKGPLCTKLLGMKEVFSSIEDDIGGTVELILLDHPEKCPIKLRASGRSSEQEIRINIVSKALNDPTQRTPTEARK